MSQEPKIPGLPIDLDLPPDINFSTARKSSGEWPPFGYSDSRITTPMSPRPAESAVDRLIALASDEPPSKPAATNGSGQTQLETVPVPEQAQMINTLMQFRSVLPFFSRLMEVTQAAAGPGSAELTRNMGELAVSQRDLRTLVQDQSVQIKRLEDEVTRAREAAERSGSDATEIIEDIHSVQSTVRKAATAVGVLLAALIGLVIWMLLHGPAHH